jgi:hypothetical protein
VNPAGLQSETQKRKFLRFLGVSPEAKLRNRDSFDCLAFLLKRNSEAGFLADTPKLYAEPEFAGPAQRFVISTSSFGVQ